MITGFHVGHEVVQIAAETAHDEGAVGVENQLEQKVLRQERRIRHFHGVVKVIQGERNTGERPTNFEMMHGCSTGSAAALLEQGGGEIIAGQRGCPGNFPDPLPFQSARSSF